MLDLLFISRRSSHSAYYQKLVDNLNFESELHVTGKPLFIDFKALKRGLKFQTEEIVLNQIRRKEARHTKLFSLVIVKFIYFVSLSLLEKLRFMKYCHVIAQKKPKHVVVWNGDKLPNKTVVAASKALGVSVIYFENGLMPNTTTCDPKGVNAKNSIPRSKDFYLSLDFNDLDKQHEQLIARKPHKKRKSKAPIEIKGDYIFVPFQVPNDTQIIVNSPWIGSMEVFFDAMTKAFSKARIDNMQLVFKEHPSWPKNFEHLIADNKNVLFANDNDTELLILNAKAVVTINSTVGLESLLLGKKVITLGNACYNIPDLVLHAKDADSLEEALVNVENWQPNEILRSNFLNFLKFTYAIPNKWRDAEKNHFKAIENRIRNVDDFSKLKADYNKSI